VTRAAKIDGRTARSEDVRERRRAQMLETALRVFGKKGFHQTSISDLVEAAGVARGTFYLYFESKDAVFLALIDALLAELRASVDGVDVSAGAPSLDSQLVHIVERVLRMAEHKRALANILFREAVGLDAAVDARLRAFYGSLRGYIAQTLHMGIALGLARDVDVDITSTLILGSIKQTIEQHLVLAPEGKSFDVPRYARAIVDYNLKGVLRPARPTLRRA
jgi:AcrR family transcriptional regulator